MERGVCLACGIRGRGRRDFLCEKCVNLEGGMIVCRNCEARIPIHLEAIERAALPIPKRPGVVIIVQSCAECGPVDAFSVLEVRTVRDAVN